MSIESLGWSPTLQFHLEEALRASSPPSAPATLVPARVIRMDGPLLRVRSSRGERHARPSGRLRNSAATPADLPTVGDWVLLEEPALDGEARIHAVLERRSLLARRRPGERVEEQALAANVDVVVLVSPLDRELRLRRLEREVALAYDSGASPVALLSKADVVGEEQARTALLEAERVLLGVPVTLLSALEERGLDEVRAYLPPRSTGVLLGPSGAGKSTLVNALLGHARMPTSPVREDDGRGRHTTTHRELLVLAHGALLIDGPGIREVGLGVDDESVADAFADVAELAAGCRFHDCAHDSEPGCAVRAATERGELDEERLASFHRLRREAAYTRSKLDEAAGRERKAREKRLSGLVDEALRRKGRR